MREAGEGLSELKKLGDKASNPILLTTCNSFLEIGTYFSKGTIGSESFLTYKILSLIFNLRF